MQGVIHITYGIFVCSLEVSAQIVGCGIRLSFEAHGGTIRFSGRFYHARVTGKLRELQANEDSIHRKGEAISR